MFKNVDQKQIRKMATRDEQEADEKMWIKE